MNTVTTPEALDMLTEVSGVTDIDPDSPFAGLNFDSLKTIQWLSLLEEQLGIEFNLQDLNFHSFYTSSVAEVLDLLHAKAAEIAKK